MRLLTMLLAQEHAVPPHYSGVSLNADTEVTALRV